MSQMQQKYKTLKFCIVIRILQAASSDRCGVDCVHFSQCQHFMNQVDYHDAAEMKLETDENQKCH